MVWRVCKEEFDAGPYLLQEYSYALGREVNDHIIAYFREDEEAMDSWDAEETREVFVHIAAMRDLGAANMELNAGAVFNEQAEGAVPHQAVKHLIPKMSYFSGKVEEGHAFLENFKNQTQGLGEEIKVSAFKILCGPVVATWLQAQNGQSWRRLEQNFKAAWCTVMQSEQALVQVGDIRQSEQENVHLYINRFE